VQAFWQEEFGEPSQGDIAAGVEWKLRDGNKTSIS